MRAYAAAAADTLIKLFLTLRAEALALWVLSWRAPHLQVKLLSPADVFADLGLLDTLLLQLYDRLCSVAVAATLAPLSAFSAGELFLAKARSVLSSALQPVRLPRMPGAAFWQAVCCGLGAALILGVVV